MKTASINGQCQKLHNESMMCDHHKHTGKFIICDYMNQNDGRCMHNKANKRKPRACKVNITDVFYAQSCRTFAAHEHDKNNRQYLPYREG